MLRRDSLAWMAGAATSLAAPMVRAATAPVRVGVIGISFHAVVGGVVQELLQRMDVAHDIQNAPHDQMFERLGRGEVDLLVTAWMPGTHAHLYRPIADRIETLATAYGDARLFWAVPAYVPADVASIADLLEPAVAARMERTIRSIGPSAGLSVRSLETARRYGLDRGGYTVVPGDTAEWVGHFRRAHDERRWIVMPLWQPQFLNRTHALRVLADPLQTLGGADDAVIVGSKAFVERAPAPVLRALRRVQIGLDAVTDMDLAVNVQGLGAREAARRWMSAEAATVARWMTA